MIVMPHHVYLLSLRGFSDIGGRPLPSKQEALDGLRKLTGQDFGIDADAWENWIEHNRASLYAGNDEA